MLAVLTFANAARAQEALVKAEELIRLQDIPLARPASFESQHPPEQLDYLAWVVVRVLDKSSSWNPRNRAWALYRANVRYSMEQSLRERWKASAGIIRSLSQNPDTALAQFYADRLSPKELDEALAFFRGPAGKSYVAYLRNLKQIYYAGLIELDRVSFDPEFGAAGDSLAERRKAWLARKGVSLETVPPGYNFHLSTARALAPSSKPENVAFALIAGAPPGSEALRRLDARLSSSDREAVSEYLRSSAADHERAARQAWGQAIAKGRDVLPLLVNDLRSMTDVVAQWQKVRADPTSLPRSIAQVDPATVVVNEDYPKIVLADDGADPAIRACLPGVGDATVRRLIDGAKTPNLRSTVSMPNAGKVLLARQGVAACIPTTLPGYPVPVLHSFTGTIRVVGMTGSQERSWHGAVVQEVAAFGASESLVVLPNGNAFEVTYAVNVRSPDSLIYGSRILFSGSYDAARYRTVVKAPEFKTLILTGNVFSGSDVPRFEKLLLTTPEELKRDEARRARD